MDRVLRNQFDMSTLSCISLSCVISQRTVKALRERLISQWVMFHQVNLKPLQVVLQKVKADLDLKQRKMKKEEEEEEQNEEEEDGTEHQETPRSIMVPPVVK
ncbi:hypothetical protein chiPu_0028756, partial [Chiloscyllium punctatum]|nr:hypothetical protein [Chiloscyllium punctatum]